MAITAAKKRNLKSRPVEDDVQLLPTRHARKYDSKKANFRNKLAKTPNVAARQRHMALRQMGLKANVTIAKAQERAVGLPDPATYEPAEWLSDAVEAPSETVTKATCDSCGKSVRVRKDGALYAHKCAE